MTRLENDLLNYKSKYEYDNGVLINLFGITNQEALDKLERMITTRQLAKLYLEDSKPPFNAEHYLSIHRFLFQDIYPFAGEIRSENMNKRISFCLPQNVYNELNRVLSNANSIESHIDSKEKLLTFITELYSDLDVIHPFREGNGRTLREFIREYMDYICKNNNLERYYFDYSNVDRERYINAVVKADAFLDYKDLLELFTEILKVKEEEKTL